MTFPLPVCTICDGVEEKLDAFLKQEGPGLMECVIDHV